MNDIKVLMESKSVRQRKKLLDLKSVVCSVLCDNYSIYVITTFGLI